MPLAEIQLLTPAFSIFLYSSRLTYLPSFTPQTICHQSITKSSVLVPYPESHIIQTGQYISFWKPLVIL